jgi:hypothetical protein
VPTAHPISFLALLVGFLGLVYFTFSRDVRGKAVAKFVVPLAFAVACATFLVASAPRGAALWLAAGVSLLAPYLVYRQLVYCHVCGSSGSVFSPFTSRDTKCKECGAPLGKPPNTSLERTRER